MVGEELRREGIPSFLLTDVFQDVDETVYADQIHCLFTESGESPGYEIMSRRIAKDLGAAWNLKERKGRALRAVRAGIAPLSSP